MIEAESTLDAQLAAIEEDGYVVLEGILSPVLVEALAEDLVRLEHELGIVPAPNDFEGHHTLRTYNLLAHGEVWQQVPLHPEVLALVERVLDPGCLVSSLSSINIGPGETAQPIHADDQLLPVARPHTALVCNSMWALTDFTEANGATRIVPGSHRRAEAPPYGQPVESIAAEMAKGSVLVWHGSLWHGGGANRSEARRVGIAMNYCAGFLRQQENQQLGIPPERVRKFPRRLQELVGYGVYNGLVGHIEKQSPLQRFGARDEFRTVWDQAG